MQQQEEEGKRTSCVFNALRAMSRESKRDGFFSGAHVYFRSGVSLFVFVCSRAHFCVVVDKQRDILVLISSRLLAISLLFFISSFHAYRSFTTAPPCSFVLSTWAKNRPEKLTRQFSRRC
jgi:hypothetical protein